MRQYGSVPPLLSTAAAPAVSSATGLGTGGACVQTQLSPNGGQGAGQVWVRAGLNAAVGGSLVLKYAAIPPTIFYAPSDAFQGFSVAGQGTVTHTLSWTNALSPNHRHDIAYQWSVSQ